MKTNNFSYNTSPLFGAMKALLAGATLLMLSGIVPGASANSFLADHILKVGEYYIGNSCDGVILPGPPENPSEVRRVFGAFMEVGKGYSVFLDWDAPGNSVGEIRIYDESARTLSELQAEISQPVGGNGGSYVDGSRTYQSPTFYPTKNGIYKIGVDGVFFGACNVPFDFGLIYYETTI